MSLHTDPRPPSDRHAPPPHSPDRLSPTEWLDLHRGGRRERLTWADLRLSFAALGEETIERALLRHGRFEAPPAGATPGWAVTLAYATPAGDDTEVLVLFGNGPPQTTTLAAFFAEHGDKLGAMERRWIVDTVRAGDFHRGGGLDQPLAAFWIVRADVRAAVNIARAYAQTRAQAQAQAQAWAQAQATREQAAQVAA